MYSIQQPSFLFRTIYKVWLKVQTNPVLGLMQWKWWLLGGCGRWEGWGSNDQTPVLPGFRPAPRMAPGLCALVWVGRMSWQNCLCPPVMNWLLKASSSSLWLWNEKSGSLTPCVTSTTRWPSHRLSSSVTPRGRCVIVPALQCPCGETKSENHRT